MAKAFFVLVLSRAKKRRRAAALQDASRTAETLALRASVLECASPLALFHRTGVRLQLQAAAP